MAENGTEIKGSVNIDASVKGTGDIDKLSKSMEKTAKAVEKTDSAVTDLEDGFKALNTSSKEGLAIFNKLSDQLINIQTATLQNARSLESYFLMNEKNKETFAQQVELLQEQANLLRAAEGFAKEAHGINSTKEDVAVERARSRASVAHSQRDEAYLPLEEKRLEYKKETRDIDRMKAEEKLATVEATINNSLLKRAQAENYEAQIELELKKLEHQRNKLDELNKKADAQILNAQTREKKLPIDKKNANSKEISAIAYKKFVDSLEESRALKARQLDIQNNKYALSRERFEYEKQYRAEAEKRRQERKRENLDSRKHNVIGGRIVEIGNLIQSRSGNNVTGNTAGILTSIVGGAVRGGGILAFGEALKTASNKLAQFTDSVLQATGQMQALKVQLSVVYGSDAEASSTFTQLKEYATKSPYGVEETTEMAILLKQSGIYASEVMDTMKMIGDISSGNNEKMKRIANNYAQIVAMGNATAKNMRQFAYAGVPAYKEIANYLGVAQSKLRKMISDGKVTSDVIEEVFKKMTSEGGMFYGAVDRGSQVLTRRLQNLRDMQAIAHASIGERVMNVGNDNGTGGYISKLIGFEEGFAKALDNWATAQNIERSVKQIEVNKSQKQDILDTIAYIKSNPDLFPNAQGIISELNSQLKELEVAFSYDKEIAAKAAAFEYDQKERDKELDYIKLNQNTSANEEYLIQLQNQIRDLKAKMPLESSVDAMKTQKEIDKLTKELSILNTADIITFNSDKGKKAKSIDLENYGAYNYKFNYSRIAKTDEAIQKVLNNKNGLGSLLTEYDDYYKSSEEGKKKTAEEKYERFANIRNKTLEYLAKNNTIGTEKENLANMKPREFIELFNYLGGNREKLDTTLENLFDTTTYELKTNANEDWNNINSAVNNLIGIISNDTESPQGLLKTVIEDLSQVRANTQGILTSDKESFDIANGTATLLGDVYKRLQTASTQTSKYSAAELASIKKLVELYEKALTTGSFDISAKDWDMNMLAELIKSNNTKVAPLWQRIISSTTGIDTNKMKDKRADEIIADWDKLQTNSLIASSMVASLKTNSIESVLKNLDLKLKDGAIEFNTQDVTGEFNGKSYTQIGGGVRTARLDYDKISKKYFEKAISGDLNSDIIKAMKDTRQSFLNAINNLAVVGLTKGEDGQYAKDVQEMAIAAYSGIAVNHKDNVVKAKVNGKDENIYPDFDDKGNLVYKIRSGDSKDTSDEIVKNNEDIVFSFENLYKKLIELQIRTINELGKLSTADVKKNFEENMRSSGRNKLSSYNMLGYNRTISPDMANVYNKSAFELLTSSADAAYNTKKNGGTDYNANLALLGEEFQNGNISLNHFLKAMKSLDDELKDMRIELEKADTASGKYNDFIAGASSNKFKHHYLDWGPSINGNTYLQNQFLRMNGNDSSTSFNGDFARGKVLNFYNAIKDYNSLEEMPTDIRRMALSSGVFSFDQTQNEFISARDKIGYDLNKADSLGGEKAAEDIDKIANALAKSELAAEALKNAFDEIGNSAKSIGMNLVSSGITDTFEQMGANLAVGSEAMDGVGEKMKELGKAALSNLGALFVQAGLSVIASSGIAGLVPGLALIAAGGMASLVSGVMSAQDQSETQDNEREKLNAIKDQLADLLAQAREDAIYYENELRHRKAISSAENISGRTTAVNDAIIAPNGNVVTTHPDDWLIATKTPEATLAGRKSNITVVKRTYNYASNVVTVEQNEKETDDGVELETIIRAVAKDVIASSDGDEAFTARSIRMQGRSTVA